MIKVLISRHNGIGDIIMSIPFIFGLPSSEYDVTYETVEENFSLINYLIPNLKLKKLTEIPFEDYRVIQNGYDVLINLNRSILHNCMCWQYMDVDGLKSNQQVLYAFIVSLHGLPVPINLSPSAYIHKEKHPTNKILIFTKSTINNRSLSRRITDRLEELCDNKQIFLNPWFDTKSKLAEEINNAKFVISVDTGTLHLAEALSTKWIGLYTNMSGITRVKYYKHGEIIQSSAECSPCNFHGFREMCITKDNKIECTYGFDVSFLINKIKENI